MRVAHVTATFPPYQGGTGNVCFYNARELARLGHEVHVFTAASDAMPLVETIEGFLVHRLKPIFRLGNAPFIPGLLKIKDFDLIHLHYPFIFGAELIWFVSKIRKIPYITTHHNDLIGIGSRKILFDVYTRLSAQRTLQGAAKLCVVSIDHALNSQLAPVYKQKWQDVVEIPNGVDTDLFNLNCDGDSIRKTYNIPRDAHLILFVAALDKAHHFKSADLLIDAFTHLDDINAYLMLVGDGDLRPGLEILVREKGMEHRVIFIGRIPNEDLPPVYAAADVLVLPSKPPESFGLVLAESLACGVPVITTNIPGVRTLVNHGVDGYLTSHGDMNDLVENISQMLKLSKLERQFMGAAGRHKVMTKYTWEKAATQLETTYQTIIYDNSAH